MVSPDLGALHDKQEITELCYRYALALDRRDWAALAACFTPDADAYYMDKPPARGYQAIEAICRTSLAPMSATQHLIGNVIVRLDGDEAESSCYLQAQHVRTGTAGGDNFIIAGRYDDRLVRTPDGWRIRERRLEVSWTEGNPAVRGRLPAHPRGAASGVSCHIRVLSKPIRPAGTTSRITRRGESRCRTKADCAAGAPGRTTAASAG